MAYEPKIWECGETLTADALNHMEKGIEEASQGGGGCDCGFECTETSTEVFNGSLTTAKPYPSASVADATFTPQQLIDSDFAEVTIDGTSYILPRIRRGMNDPTASRFSYGEDDGVGNPIFTNYPAYIVQTADGGRFTTPSEGTYQVTIKEINADVSSMTPCFVQAVKDAINQMPIFISGVGYYSSEAYFTYDDSVFDEIVRSIESGNPVYLLSDSAALPLGSIEYEKDYSTTPRGVMKITGVYFRNYPLFDSDGKDYEWIHIYKSNDNVVVEWK